MTDTPSVPPTPDTPPPPAATPAAAGPKQTQSLTSFIIGLAAFLFAAVPFVNFLAFIAGIVAVVIGFRARKSEPGAPPWMSLVGIIGGFVAIGLSLITGIVYLVTLVAPFLFLGSYGVTY